MNTNISSASMRIGTREIGQHLPPFVIAEMSGNHNQSLERALKIVEAAAASGGVGWSSLLPGTINLTKSIVNTSNFTLGTGLLTVDFGFLCYVA